MILVKAKERLRDLALIIARKLFRSPVIASGKGVDKVALLNHRCLPACRGILIQQSTPSVHTIADMVHELEMTSNVPGDLPTVFLWQVHA